MTKATHEELEEMGADLFHSETRRGWLANNCSWIGAGPDATRQQYVKLFIERCKGRDLDELLEMGDAARPSNMPTAYEREIMLH